MVTATQGTETRRTQACSDCLARFRPPGKANEWEHLETEIRTLGPRAMARLLVVRLDELIHYIFEAVTIVTQR